MKVGRKRKLLTGIKKRKEATGIKRKKRREEGK